MRAYIGVEVIFETRGASLAPLGRSTLMQERTGIWQEPERVSHGHEVESGPRGW